MTPSKAKSVRLQEVGALAAASPLIDRRALNHAAKISNQLR